MIRQLLRRQFTYSCCCGVGFSVQYHHVAQLPPIVQPHGTKIHQITDDVEGWAASVAVLINSYLPSDGAIQAEPIFDASLVRPAGTIIKSVQMPAPGPEPLLKSLEQVRRILKEKKNDTKLSPIEVLDIMTIASNCVISGGVRRSAMICLFSPDDDDMLTAKSGDWWKTHDHRARSNNSAVIYRGDPKAEEHFNRLWKILSTQQSGEPGIFFTSDSSLSMGTNPCAETALHPYQFCNLTEINAATIVSQEDFNDRASHAAFIGTLQAGYTNFHHLCPIWKTTTEADALLGIGITGVAHGKIYHLDETLAVKFAMETNVRMAKILGINRTSRLTCIKPSGTTSIVMGCSSGIHGIHAPYYVRRLRISKLEPIYQALKKYLPELLEDERAISGSYNGVLSLPIRAHYDKASYRCEAPIEFLERVKRYNERWIVPGHYRGINHHNVSATVSVGKGEWKAVGEWLWNNRECYSGITCFPSDNTFYEQPPFEECTEEQFDKLHSYFKNISVDDLFSAVRPEEERITDLNSMACSGGVCDL